MKWLYNSKGKAIAFEKDKRVFSKKGKIIGQLNEKQQIWSSTGYQGEIVQQDRLLFHSATGSYVRVRKALVSSRSVSTTPSLPPSKAAIALPSAYRDIDVEE